MPGEILRVSEHMQTSGREQVLSRIRAALKHNASSAPLRPDSEKASRSDLERLAQEIKSRCAGKREDLISRFESELYRVGGKFCRCQTADAAISYIRALAESKGAKSAVGWNSDLLAQPEIIETIIASGISFTDDNRAGQGDDFIKTAIDAGFGISGVDYALAETGTLVVLAGEGRARSASLLPPVHVALVRPDQFINGLDDLFPLLRYQMETSQRGMSSAVTFITGPSRTADIELTLVVGVHGPQELHVLLLDLE